MTSPDQDLATRLIHHPYRPPEAFDAVMPAVHKASTVFFPTVAKMRARDWRSKAGYSYGLHGTPTLFTLEERIAELEGARHALLVPSGLAAITLIDLALLSAGDEMLLPGNVYNPSRELARTMLQRLDIGHRTYDPFDLAVFGALLGERTRLVWIEAPGSVTMEFPDLRGLVRTVREKAPRALVALDHTWGAGIAYRPFDLGDGLAADVAMHALTKYPSGGADVLMGSVATVREDLHEALLRAHVTMGIGVAANDAELLLRSLPTLALRYRAHDAAAREVAAWLARQPGVAELLHPAFPGAPGHAHWAAHCTDAAGLFSVRMDPALAPERVDAFVDALKLFRIGFSWGGPASLVVPYDLQRLRGAPAGAGTLVRFSIGLESPADLIADLAQALRALA